MTGNNTENRVQFTCEGCEKEVDREPKKIDCTDITPARCVDCTLNKMKE